MPHPASSARAASSTSVFFPPAAVLDHTAGDKVQGFALVQQRNRNSLMHSKYGNTTLRLQPLGTVVQAKVELSLEALIPNFTYTRSFLLQCHTPPEPNNDLYPQLPILIDRSAVIQTTPPSLTTGSAAKARTGRRHRAFNKNGKLVYFQPRSRRKTRRPHRIHELSNRRGMHGINRIYGIKTLTKHRVPPPRGTPGASPEADEEYPHPGQTAKGQSRGAMRRRWRRSQYRLWRRITRPQRDKGAGSLLPAVSPPKKASHNRARWFRQSLLWQQTYPRQRKHKVQHRQTTPPLPYARKFRVGSLKRPGVRGYGLSLKTPYN